MSNQSYKEVFTFRNPLNTQKCNQTENKIHKFYYKIIF